MNRKIPGERMAKLRPVLFAATALAACLAYGYGLFREEIGEVLFNAAML